MKAFVSLLALTFISAFARAEVQLKPSITSATAGTVEYQFDLYSTDTAKTLSDSDLAVDMEKKLHLIVYDPALKEFQHLHPEFDGKNWHVQATFAVDGEYWVWAQGKVKSTKKEFAASMRLTITGGAAAWPAPPTLGDVRMGSADISAVQLGSDKIYAGQMVMLDIAFGRNDGSQPSLSPYLGAFAHVVAVSNDGSTLEHVHPMDNGDNTGMLHATFPTAGDYRLWIQFIDGGELKVIPLSVTVLP